MLTAKQKQDWVDALKSGNYRQTQKGEEGFSCLKGPNGYCCLGVLAELNGWETETEGLKFATLPEEGAMALAASDDWENAINGTMRECGLPEHPEYLSLAKMNDSGISFAEIAEFLDKHLLTQG